jgi:soluble lytic murein transglycosylase-like protein
LIFVFSILGAVTGKHPPVSRPYVPQKPSYSEPYDTSSLHSEVNVALIPGYAFSAGYAEGLVDSMKKFILSYAKKTEDWEAQNIANSILMYGQKYDVNPKLVCALIARESRFNRFAVSSSGAQGLGQLLPSTASGLGVTDAFDIDQNVMGTSRYLKSLLDRFAGPQKVTFSLAGYLEGPNIVKQRGSFKASSKRYIEDIYQIYSKI